MFEQASGRHSAGDHQPPSFLVIPAECRDAGITAEEDPGLTGRCLRREIWLPTGDLVTARVDPPFECWHPAVGKCSPQNWFSQPIDFEKDHTRNRGFRRVRIVLP